MNKLFKFLFIEIAVFAAMGIVTFFEITNFGLFESIFNFIKTPSAWFIGLSLSYAFSNLFQKSIFSFFSRKRYDDTKEKGDFFIGFIITLIITSLITPFVRDAANYFFGSLFIYFHIILMQSVVLLYLLFKFKNNYKISGKYFLTSELIILFYTAIILIFIN